MPQDSRQQDNSSDLQQENQRLLLLQRIALIAADHRDRATLLQAALDDLQRFFSVDGGGIYQLDHSDAPRCLTASLGIPAELVRELQKIPVGKGLTEQVLRSGAPCSWVDLRWESQLYCQAVIDAGWRSMVSLPLVAGERTVGTLFLFQRISRQFSSADVDLLLQVCRILASAIATTELVEKLEWQQQMTEAGQRELERSRSQLRAHLARLEESNRALELTNRTKIRFLGLASHELRTPLTCVLSAAELLQLKLPEAADEVRDLLDMLEQGGLRLQTLIEDLMEMVRIESRDLYLSKEPLDLPRILTELHLDVQTRAKDRTMTLTLGSIPASLALLGDDHHLRRALNRLLDNALKYTPEGGRIHLETRYCQGLEVQKRQPQLENFCPDFFSAGLVDNYLLLRIIDSGTGVDETERLRIFDTFYVGAPLRHHGRHPKTGSRSGAGLGLSLAKGIIERQGGMLWVEAAGGDHSGSSFQVLLPLQKTQEALIVGQPPGNRPWH